ncbi:MAG: acetyltransferase [Candidatus Alkaliphilus sp. MAG34]
MDDIILIGGGGHCKSVIDTINRLSRYNIIGVLDIQSKVGTQIAGIKIIGTDDDLGYFYKKGTKYAFLAAGSIGDTFLRRGLYTMAADIGYILPNIIDDTAIISKKVRMGIGNFIGKGVIINSDTTVGDNCIINTGSIIEHDCHIEDFCHIAPGGTLSGGVKVGKDTHIGTNATIIQNIKIGSNTIIGAGAVLLKDIGDNKKAYGNPCREV